jgi:hypothetical protein
MSGMDQQYIVNVDMNANTTPIHGDTDVDMSSKYHERKDSSG